MGKMGSGKTLSMTIIATYLARQLGAPLFSNYSLINSGPIRNLKDLWQIENGIICLDEVWLTMDSRLWKDNVNLTRWVNQTRKKKVVVFYTTQHIRQVELRMRQATDILIYCEKKPAGHWLNFVDYQYNNLMRRFLIADPRPFYSLYNTFEVVNPISGH